MWADKESEIDYLNFSEISEQAIDVITSRKMLPISIGVFGNWGAGKSTILRLIEKDLKKINEASGEKPKYILVDFDAWLYQGYDDARTALLEVISNELNKAAKGNKSLLKKTKSLLDRINIFRLLGLGAEGIALLNGVPTGGLLARSISSTENLLDAVQGKNDLAQDEYQDLLSSTKDGKKALENIFRNATKITPPQQID